jgi:uncharacterized protein
MIVSARRRHRSLGALLAGGLMLGAMMPSIGSDQIPVAPGTSWRTAVRQFAETHLKQPAWGFSHSVRDYQLAKQLAAADHVALDDDVLYAAAYLHDVGAFAPYAKGGVDNGVDHSDIGADIVPKLLSGTGFPMTKIDQVRAAIRTHMYYRKPVGPEAIYLHDADALDWLGAIGVARNFALVDPNGGDPDGPAALKLLQQYLVEVPPGIVSNSGRAEGVRRARELREFLRELGAETEAFKTL